MTTHQLSLAGQWRFVMDRDDVGIAQQWFSAALPDESVNLPGSMTENGKGDEVTLETQFTGRIRDTSLFDDPRYEPYRQPGNIKFPCWLTPEKYYKGVAWYQVTVTVPGEWTDRVVHLHLERAHWFTQVWVDGREIGSGESLSTPHRYALGKLQPGEHVVTVRVDNRLLIDVGEDAHSVTDHSQTSWNGLIGALELVSTPAAWIENVQVYPAADRSSVRCQVALSFADGAAPASGQLLVQILDASGSEVAATRADLDAATATQSVTVPVTSAVQPWDEFTPSVYTAKVTLHPDSAAAHTHETNFGFRTFAALGRQCAINGRPIVLRGTLECAVFPLTGYPPTDKAEWLRILRICQSYGLNHMRFHSWCPPRAAFQAADELGIIFAVECASWTYVGENADYDAWLYREADRILAEYGNHPSFCLMLYGNEPYGDTAAEPLSRFVNHYKAQDDRRLFSGGTAWPLIPENQFHIWMNPRIHLWDANLESRINKLPPETVTDYTDFIAEHPQPIISHEIGQWCVYPDFDEIPKYTGVLKARNFEIFRDFLHGNGMGHLEREFLAASGRLQVICYKEEIESALRTPEMAGFELLDLHDFPGQGTALVGVLNAFWGEKGYVTTEEFRRFCNQIVPLAKMPKRIYTAGETFDAEVMLSQFAQDDLPAGSFDWTLRTVDGATVYAGQIAAPQPLQAAQLHTLGHIRQELNQETAARKLNLEIARPGTDIANDWDIWVYPQQVDTSLPPDVISTGELTPDILTKLEAGATVFFMPDNDRVLGDARGQVPPGFSSIFWNTAWTQGQAPHTLGILCDPAHPALAQFPTESHSNWQWWYIIQRSRSMILDPLSAEVEPIVRVIDDWFTARRLGLVIEGKIGAGRLLLSSINLKDGAPGDPVCRQMLHSLTRYVAAPEFNPTVQLEVESLAQVVKLSGICREERI